MKEKDPDSTEARLKEKLEEARKLQGASVEEWHERAVKAFGRDLADLLVGKIKRKRPPRIKRSRAKALRIAKSPV